MFFAAIELMGPIKIQGSLEAYTLTIVAPARPENEREQTERAVELALPTIEAGSVKTSWYFKIASGATARIGEVVASDLYVDGELVAGPVACQSKIEVAGSLVATSVSAPQVKVGPGAVLDCAPGQGTQICAHRTSVLRGGALEFLKQNMWWARSMLAEAEKNPLTWFDKVDKNTIARLAAGFYLMGWYSYSVDRSSQETLFYPTSDFVGTVPGVTLPFDLASSVENEDRVWEAFAHLAHPRGAYDSATHSYEVVTL